jgi:hypothetical protein
MRRILICQAVASAALLAATVEPDMVVVGGTPGGIACAIRGARQGLKVVLVNYSNHLGGMLTGGIGVMDTLYEGRRSPVLDEFQRRVLDYYRKKYGEKSPQYLLAMPGHRTESPTPKRLTFEPHVAQHVINEMVGNERNIEVLKGYYPSAVERSERTIRSVILTPFANGSALRITGAVFVDATYEGDLAAVAGAPYRVGRESREEYGEPHAGRIFTKRFIAPGGKGAFPTEALIGGLNLRPFQAVTQAIFAGSTGEGDELVQAYHYRLCLTNDPANRRLPEKPAWYDPTALRALMDEYRSAPGEPSIPNRKAHWFQNFSGGSSEYPTAGWSKRREIMNRHRDFALGALYFLQYDPSVPEDRRLAWRQWGLAKDEFVDNDNFPYELYVREARRIVGRYVFTEHDATLARGYERTPVHADSIAITDWFMDSHEVSTERRPGSDPDGKIILSELTRPSQIPFRALVPQNLDNLLVPVCLSASHVGWGAIRLEPTWMHVGESAGWAAAIARRRGVAPAAVPVEELQRTLAESGVMLSFFNDVDMSVQEPWLAAVQYLGARGFFGSYDARPGEPLTAEVAAVWGHAAGRLLAGRPDHNEAARRARRAESERSGRTVTAGEFAETLTLAVRYWALPGPDPRGLPSSLGLDRASTISRGDAARMVFELLRNAGR